MNSINNNFEMKDNKIVVRNLTNLPFPYIQTVELGKKYRDVNELLKKIGTATSRYNSVYTGIIGNMIKQRGKRMASPVYVSIIRDGREFRPIVTTLNYVFEMDVQKLIENPGSAGLDPKLFRNTIEEFKEAIL
jgi:CRISPR-associated protein Cmr1